MIIGSSPELYQGFLLERAFVKRLKKWKNDVVTSSKYLDLPGPEKRKFLSDYHIVLDANRSVAGTLVDASRDSLAASLVKTIDEIVLSSVLDIPSKKVKKPLTKLVCDILVKDFQEHLPVDTNVFEKGTVSKDGCNIKLHSHIDNLEDQLFGKYLSDTGYKLSRDQEGDLILVKGDDHSSN